MILDYIKGYWLKIYLFFLRKRRVPGELYKPHSISPSPHDKDDYTLVGEGVELPSSYKLPINPYKYVKSQGQWSSCAAHGAYTTPYEITNEILNNQFKGIEFSERWGYYYVRQKEGTFPNNVGVYMRDMLDLAANKGHCPEKLCPYISDQMNEEPSNMADGFAPLFKAGEYFRIIDLATLKEALYVYNLPIRLGVYVTSSFMDNFGPIKTGEKTKYGGHSILCLGYDDENEELLILNEWGDDWKDFGIARMPYKYYEDNCFEAWMQFPRKMG